MRLYAEISKIEWNGDVVLMLSRPDVEKLHIGKCIIEVNDE